ncbi:MAG: carbohydrate porin [Candidatus Omnitrophota bacterium]
MIRRIFITVLVLGFAAVLVPGIAMAGEMEMMAEIQALKARVAELEHINMRVTEIEKQLKAQSCSLFEQNQTVEQVRNQLIQYRPGEGVAIPPCGLEISADATLVIQGSPNANNAGEKHDKSIDAAWSSDIFIQRAFDDWGKALIHLEPGQGQGAEDQLLVFSNVNRDQNDTDSNVPVTELWYEHYLFNKQVVLTAGKLDPANYLDQNEYAHDECTQFLGRMFKQNPAIEWPNDNTLGGRLTLAPDFAKYLSIETTYFDADNNWENVFARPFVSVQLNLKPSMIFGWDPEQWDGNYRFYTWFNDMPHRKLVMAGDAGGDDWGRFNTGVGFSIDQMVTDVFGVFGRFGWQRPDLVQASTNPSAAPVEGSWSGGIQMTGKHWNRNDDILAFGVGQLFPSAYYKDAFNAAAPEGHFEAYYKIRLFKWLAITPDIQIIWNPHGVNHSYLGEDKTIFVYGIRSQLDF